MAHRIVRVPFRLRAVAQLTAIACCAFNAQAQSGPPASTAGASAGTLKEVVISGSRSEQHPDEIPASIDVINRKDLEERQIRDIRDVAKDIPNVSVQRSPARFTPAGVSTGRDGNAGFNIRGLEGNRVLILEDGIRQPRSYVFSANAFGRDYLDVGLVQRVEIIKGSTSALYGSDGMAGLVNFITVDPGNYLTSNKGFGGSASLRYDGDNNGVRASVTMAGRFSPIATWLIGATGDRGHELENKGNNDTPNASRTEPNPQRDKGHSALVKLVLEPDGMRHVFTFEHVRKRSTYDLLSAVTAPPLGATFTIDADSFTNMERNRFSWNGRARINTVMADELQAVLSWQKAQSREYVFEDRNTTDRVRDTYYWERSFQTYLQAGKTIRMGPDWAQKLVYGAEYVYSKITNLQDGVVPAAGETFPLKRFPDTREKYSALFLQDEIVGRQWSITPGLRYDRFSLDASQAGFSPPSIVPAASIDGSALSPKLGVMFRPSAQWSVYGNYAAGFRAPNANQVNGYFQNITGPFFYRTVPNPDLKPEKSQTAELGVRGRFSKASFDAAVFTGRFKDFIEDNVQVSGAGTALDPVVFQTVNLSSVRISGFELKGDAVLAQFGGGALSTLASYGRTKGKDTGTGNPINSVIPGRLLVGLKYDTSDFGVRFDVTHYEKKKADDVTVVAPATQFLTPAATVFDLTGQWRIRRDLRLNAGVYNLTDKKYFRWTDVRGQSAVLPGVATIDAYSQPGRYVRVSLVGDF